MEQNGLSPISKGAFLFCRSTIAAVLWIALIFQVKWLLFVSFLLLATSALSGIKRAPLIVMYTNTLERLIPSAREIVDERGIRFAQALGAALNLLCLLFLYLLNERIGWGMVLIVAILKTAGAFGFCGGLKMYQCLFGKCCPISLNRAAGK